MTNDVYTGDDMRQLPRVRRNFLPRKSKRRGMEARLAIRQGNTPSDLPGKTHYTKAGSMNRR